MMHTLHPLTLRISSFHTGSHCLLHGFHRLIYSEFQHVTPALCTISLGRIPLVFKPQQTVMRAFFKTLTVGNPGIPIIGRNFDALAVYALGLPLNVRSIDGIKSQYCLLSGHCPAMILFRAISVLLIALPWATAFHEQCKRLIKAAHDPTYI